MTETDWPPVDPQLVAAQIAAVRRRIESSTETPQRVRLLAVTKTFGPDAIRAALDAGCSAIGESYAQEMVTKLAQLQGEHPSARRPEVHFIGRLQTNKVRSLVGLVDVIETVDRQSLVDEIARRLPGQRIFVQVNVSDEPQKGGCPPSDTAAMVAAARHHGLQVEGLMTIGRAGPPEAAAAGFHLLRQLADDLGLAECSMGMSDDLEVAVAAGSTEVRIGSALFGARVRGSNDVAR